MTINEQINDANAVLIILYFWRWELIDRSLSMKGMIIQM